MDFWAQILPFIFSTSMGIFVFICIIPMGYGISWALFNYRKKSKSNILLNTFFGLCFCAFIFLLTNIELMCSHKPITLQMLEERAIRTVIFALIFSFIVFLCIVLYQERKVASKKGDDHDE